MFFLSAFLSSSVFLAARHSLAYRFSWSAQPILALIAGLLILVRPKLLNFIVAIYLILVGVIGIFHISW